MLRTLILGSLFLTGCYDFSKFDIIPDAAESATPDLGSPPDAAELDLAESDLAGADLYGADLGKPDLGPACGVCVPGAVTYSADTCSVRTCKATCAWGPWDWKPGAQCSTGSSVSCVTGSSSGTRQCLACTWGACK